MANRDLFSTARKTQAADTINEAGGKAYKMSERAALAQLAATGCLSNTFYVSAKSQLDKVLKLANKVSQQKTGNEFLAKLAIYSRQHAFMKDMPALLLTILAVRDPDLYERVFPQIVDNGKMLRNHVQILRSGQVDGRRSMPAAMRRQIRKWFRERNNHRLFKDTVGNDPSLADIIKMVHPKPRDAEQDALFGYILGREYNAENLPPLVKQYEAFKADKSGEVPDVPFQMLDSLGLEDKHWFEIAKNARWQMTRMNLNTFQRHNVFRSKERTKMIANRLQDEHQIKSAKAFPYQLMGAYLNADSSVPFEVRDALQEAMEIAVSNIPHIDGEVYVFVDVSGSMQSPVTGYQGRRQASKVMCVDAAALIGASIMRANKHCHIMPFHNSLFTNVKFNPRDSIMTNAQKIKNCGWGGTSLSLGPKWLAKNKKKVDLIIFVSDNESWLDSKGQSRYSWYGEGGTATMDAFEQIKRRNPKCKMVCIDLQPNTNTQAPDRNDILNVGGFSDVVFNVIAQFNEHGMDPKHWVDVINKEIEL